MGNMDAGIGGGNHFLFKGRDMARVPGGVCAPTFCVVHVTGTYAFSTCSHASVEKQCH